MMTKKRLFIAMAILTVLSGISFSQALPDSITITPAPQYATDNLHNLVFGEHWRSLWAIPVKVEILDLGKFAGGITPIKRGGGQQTKSLRFKGNDGNYWKFRSMDKDPSKVLPEALRTTLAADVMQDQISSANPMAPLIVAPILEAVGILQAKPLLVYMPDDERLGKYRNEFACLLGMIEIHPDVEEEDGIDFNGAEQVKGTFKLLHRLEEKRSEKFDSKEFLKARLIDVFLGDWDRHTDQWRWAKYKEENNELWKPIPRDRDQAFARFDGLAVRVAEYLIPQFNHFSEEYTQIEDLTWSGRYLDRRILTEITKEEWDSVTVFIYKRLTNEVIEKAVKSMPKEHFDLEGRKLISDLISRREKLKEASDEYYEIINSVVDIYCSNKKDYIEVNRLSDMSTEVKYYKKQKKSDLPKGELLYHKVFDNHLTKEIRIYTLDDDDYILINGEVNSSPLVRIISGEGKDKVVDNSTVNGYALSILPIPKDESKTFVYDSGKKTTIKFNNGTKWNKCEWPEPNDDYERYEPALRDRGYDWLINPVVSISSDNGLIIGGGPKLYKYNFRADPYDYMMSLSAEYASKPHAGSVEYEGIFNSLIDGAEVKINAFATGLTLTQFYGFGNETPYYHALAEEDYYEIEQGVVRLGLTLGFELSDAIKLNLISGYTYVDTEIGVKKLLADFYDYFGGDYGLRTMRSINSGASLEYDSRDNEFEPSSGFFFNARGTYFPEVLNMKSDFTKGELDIRAYFPLDYLSKSSIAFRLGGGKTWGKYPFIASQFLGGKESLRGFNRERFAGDAKLFGQMEVRASLGRIRVIIPGDLGLSLFGETGRVFANNLPSKKWHPSYGIGGWLSYLDKMFTLSLSVGHSADGFTLWTGTSLMF